MLNNSLTTVTLKDFMDPEQYFKQWRWRIEELGVLLLDKNDQVIPTMEQDYAHAIKIGVTFPTLFNDTDPNKDIQTFLGHELYCRSTYAYGSITLIHHTKSDIFTVCFIENGEPLYFESCQVPEEFSVGRAKTSPDGKFTFKLLNDETTLNFDQVAKMKINLKGSYIPFQKKNHLMIDQF